MENQDAYFRGLNKQVTVEERPIISSTPLIGPLVVRIRGLWNGVLTKWRLLQIQNQVNSTLVEELRQQSIRMNQEAERLADLDRTQTTTHRDTAVLSAQIRQLNRRLQELDDRLARLEKSSNKSQIAGNGK